MGPFLPFATRRLLLRPFAPADAPALAAYRSDPSVARYQSWEAPYPLGHAERLVAEMAGRRDPVRNDWLQIAVDHDGELAGDVAVGLDDDGRIARIGYSLAPAFQRRGLALEAAGAVVDRLFAAGRVHRVEASIDPRNVPSARLLELLGFELEGTSRAAVHAGDEWLDDVRYGLLREQHAAWGARARGRPGDVALVEITPSSARAVMSLQVHPHQRRFVASVAESYADAMFPDSVHGVPVVPWLRAVQADGVLAGFVMVAERTADHPEPFLWRLLVDRWHQRRGIGDQVLALLVARLRAAGEQSLLVSWHPGRGGPEAFYLARGFVPTGRTLDDEVEARLTL